MTKRMRNTFMSGTVLGVLMYIMTMSVIAVSEPLSEVDLTIDGESESVETSSKVVEDVLNEVGYKYSETDKVNHELDDRVIHEMEIVINSEKEISLSKRGESDKVETNASTVSELLSEEEIEVGSNDVVIPSLESKLADGDEVAVIHHVEEEYEKESKIKHKVDKKYSFQIPYGEKSVKQKGKDGKKESSYKRVIKNEITLSDKKVSSEVTKEPITEKVVIGTKEVIEEDIPNKTITKKDSSMYKGETKVKKGSKGIKVKTYKNDGSKRKLVSEEIEKKPVDKVVRKGTKEKPKKEVSESTKTSAKYTLSQFKFNGVVHDGGRKYTYYSQSVLPGGGLSIPGRHINSGGYVADSDGYIVVASNRSISKGTVIDTPFGYKGKVYDICASCSPEWFDIYTE